MTSEEMLEYRYGKRLDLCNLDPLVEGEWPPAELPERRCIDVDGREEHEAILKDAAKCKELGVDQMYETIVYLKRWGSWLDG